MKEITIKIYQSSEEDGYFYDIYDTNDVDEDTESIDGGFCTTTMENAIDMAQSQAKDLLKLNIK